MSITKDNAITLIKSYFNRRNIIFFLFCPAAFLPVYTSVNDLLSSSSNGEYYSHIALIPLVSMYLMYQNRQSIFSDPQYSYTIGIPILCVGAIVYVFGSNMESQLNQNDYTSIVASSAVIFINGAFILSYGIRAFIMAIFPLLFLIFSIPIPSLLMENIISFLQTGSTEFSNVLFKVTGVSFLREGFIFHLPSISVEVAKECSGIRSSLALFITALLAGHLFLNTRWRKIALIVISIPIAMFKNGIRIVTLTLLGAYVDPRILQSSLHREGGIPFFIVALILMAPILYYLRRGERKKRQ